VTVKRFDSQVKELIQPTKQQVQINEIVYNDFDNNGTIGQIAARSIEGKIYQ
jgi:hypothetical protein